MEPGQQPLCPHCHYPKGSGHKSDCPNAEPDRPDSEPTPTAPEIPASQELEQRNDRSPELADKVRKRFAEIAADEDRFIDKGGAGRVYHVFEGICVKIMTDYSRSPAKDILDYGNDVMTEAEIHHHMQDLEVAGARCPIMYGCLERKTPGDPNGIIMEELDAVNLSDVLNGRKKIPASCDPNKFINTLVGYVTKMHEDKKVVHGDLEARNVMIDNDSGLPRIIDFGRSAFLDRIKEGEAERLIRKEWEDIDVIDEALMELTDEDNHD